MIVTMMTMTSYNAILQNLFTLSLKKPSNAIVSFMKVCKRTPPSKIPLTFHRRVGRGNGERGVERKRREGGRRDYKKYLELCKIPLRLDPEKMDNREERDSGLFPN